VGSRWGNADSGPAVHFHHPGVAPALGSGAVERVYWFGFWDFDPAITTFDRGLTTMDYKPKPGLRVFEIMAGFVNGRPHPPHGILAGAEKGSP
jgi:hypothetical protein